MLFKLYPWEWLFREEFGRHLPKAQTQFIEPPWKALLSTKGLMPMLWDMAPNHPNLLPCFFTDDPRANTLGDRVEKPLHSREGANIRVIRAGGAVESTPGDYGGPAIVQALAPTARFEGGHAVIGSWVVASQPAGIGIREMPERSRATRPASCRMSSSRNEPLPAQVEKTGLIDVNGGPGGPFLARGGSSPWWPCRRRPPSCVARFPPTLAPAFAAERGWSDSGSAICEPEHARLDRPGSLARGRAADARAGSARSARCRWASSSASSASRSCCRPSWRPPVLASLMIGFGYGPSSPAARHPAHRQPRRRRSAP